MPQNKETRVSKNSTFEEWRQSTNRVSFDVGPIESNDDLTADSLDKETRLTDQAKTVSVISGAASSTNIDVGASAGWTGYNAFYSVGANNTKGSTAYSSRNYVVDASEIPDQKFAVADNGNVTLAPNTKIFADNNITNAQNSAGTDGGMFLEANTFLENNTLRGKTVTFSGTINADDLNSRYSVKAFIKYLSAAPNYNLIEEVNAELTTSNSFSISLDIPEGTVIPQVGFLVSGVNANAATTSIANTSIVIESLALAISAGASEIISDAEEFIRDQSNGFNNVGIRIDLAPDKKVDMTAGHIIFTGSTGAPTDFVAGKNIEQYTGNNSSNVREFSAEIVSVVKSGSNITKLLITNAVGVFNPALLIGSADNYSTAAQQIAANKIVRQVTGLLDHGYVRVYKTNSGTTTKLEQGIGIANGFHLPRATFALPLLTGSTLPATYLEGERIYQTSNNAKETSSNVAFFSAKILIATTTANKYGLGAAGGLILYDTDGTFDPTKNIRGATGDLSDTNAVIGNARYTATHNDCVLDNTFSSIIRLNTPAVTGDSFSVEFASAVDAIVEVQDDIGKIEDIASNAVQAKFGASAGQKSLVTSDVVTTLNTLQDMVGNSVLPTIANNAHLVPANITTISGLAKSVIDFIGDTNLSDANLGATANTSSTLTDAITTIKNFIGSTDISDITTGENVTTTIAQLHDEVGDVTTLDATGTASAGGFDTEVLTTALIELRTLVCPGDIDDAATALSANAGNAANFAATTNTDGVIELQTIIGDRTGISTADLIGTAAATNTIVGQINHIKAEIGTATLGTTAADDIASAINELETNIRGTLNNYTIDDNLNAEATYVRNNGIIDALNDLTTYIGNTAIGGIGAATTITSAVNKMHAELGDPDSLNANPTSLNVGTTDGTGGFRNTTGASEATVVSALTELRQALLGNTANLAAVTNARIDTTTQATIENALPDLANLAGYSKTNIIDAILEIQDLMGDVTSLTNATNDFNTARITDSLVELKTALVGTGDLTDTIATLDDDSTDFAGTNVVDAITEIQADLGQQSLLTASPFHADLYTTTGSDVYASTDFQLAINGITAAIGNADIGIAINSGSNETLTQAIRQLRIDIGDVGDNGVNLAAATGYSATNLNSAIYEIQTDIGDVTNINNATGYVATSAVTGITEIQGLIGNPVATAANLGSINTRVQKDTSSSVAATETTIPMADTTGVVAGMTVLNIETGRTSSIAAGTKVTTVNADSIVVDTDVVSTINSGDTLRFDVSTVVNAINAIDARIGSEINATTMGTTATTLVPAIKEITDEIGDVTAGNLGTTSSTIVTSIKELVDGTGAATVTVKNTSGQQPTGKLNRVSASAQTLIGDIDFNSPGAGATNTTTFTFGANTVLDVSAGTLKMSSDAAGVFNVSSAFINLQPSANTGAGLQVDRSGITGATIETGEDAIIQWIESSVNTNNPASAHNTSDIAWHVKGLTSATSPADYNKPNVDFQNAYRLFGIGTTNVANSMSNVTVTWDATNHNFDVSLNDTTTDMTGGGTGSVGSGATAGLTAWGTTAKIPQIHVDRQGRIAGIAEVDMSDFLGTFNVLGDTGTQAVASGNNLKFVGTAGEIETAVTDVSGTRTVTIGLPNNVDVDGTFGVAGNVNLVSGNGASSVITLGGSNTTTTVAGTLNIPGILNVTGTNNSVTVSNTTITGDALVLRTEDDGVPANSDTPKFVINRGFSTTVTTTQIVAGQRYKIVSGTGFTSIGADNNIAGTVFTATGAGSSNTGTAKLQRNEAAIVWNEQYDQFLLTRGGDAGAVSTNTQQGSIIAQGDTIGSATKFTVVNNGTNADRSILFMETDGTSQLMRDGGLNYNPSTNVLKLLNGGIDAGQFQVTGNGSNQQVKINSNTNAQPLEISRLGGSTSQVMKVGVTDTEVTFNYIEDTSSEGKNVFGKYRFLLNGNHDDADEVTDRSGLLIDKDQITARGLSVTTNGMSVTGVSTLAGALTHTGFFTQERHDVDGSTVLGHELNDRIIGAHFQSKVTTSGNKSVLQIEDRRSTAANDGAELYSSATKGIQHKIDGTYMSFLDFQASSGSNHQAILGGISHGTRKTYISGNGTTTTKIYNNTNNATASELVLETKAGGVIVNGNLDTDSADVTGDLTIGTFKTEAYGLSSLSPKSPVHIIKTVMAGTSNTLLTLETVQSDITSTPNKQNIDFRTQDTNNGTNLARISSAVVNDTDYGDNNEATSNLIFGVTQNGSYNERMIITGRGDVGIGTLNPAQKLDVAGTSKAHSFLVNRDDAAEISIQQTTIPAGQTTNSINKIKLSNNGEGDRVGLLQVQSKQLGETAGDVTTQALFKARNGNTSYLQVIDQRDANGSDWTFAHKRLEFGIDTTRMSYIAQNLNENYGLEIGSSGHGAADAAFASQPWISMKKAASGNGPGAVELYHGNAGTSTKKFETTTAGANLTGDLTIPGTGRIFIGDHDYSNSAHGQAIANAKLHIRSNDANDAKLIIEADADNNSEGANAVIELWQDGQRVGGRIETTASNGVHATDSLDNSLLISAMNDVGGNQTHIQFATDGDAPQYGTAIGKVRMTIRDQGNVGIGVNDPDEKLEVSGNVKLSGIIDQNGTGTNDFEGQIDCNKDVKTTASGKGFYAFGGGSDYLTMTHDGSGGHITSSDKLEIETPIFEVRKGAGSEIMIKAVQDSSVTLYNNNVQRLVTTASGVRIGTDADDVATASYVDGTRFNPSNLEVNQITFDRGLNSNDAAYIRFVSTEAGVNNRSALDIKITDDVSDTVSVADKIRMRMQSGAVNSGNEYSLVEISGKSNGSTRMDLTQSPGATSEVIADTFTGDLVGNASTASTLSATLTVAKGGTGATAFADKSVIISQDSGTDTLAAVTMSTNGQLLIGGTSGPAAATLTAGNGIDITNGNGTITVTAELATASNTGVAKFSTSNFLVSSGNVTIKDLGVATAEIANDAVTFAKMQNVATDTIMGRTAAGTGDAKALSAAEARGVLNVANGADNYGSWKLQVNSSTTTDIGTGETVNFAGSGATSVSRAGNTINIASSNTTYTAAGGGSSTSTNGIWISGTTFKLGSDIRPFASQAFGNSAGTKIKFSTRYDASSPAIEMFTSLSSSAAFYLAPASKVYQVSDRSESPGSDYQGVIDDIYSVRVTKKTPTLSDELSSKQYVDSKQPKMAACTHSGSTATDIKNCTVSRTAVGKYTVTLSTDKGSGSFPHIVASLQNDYSTGSLGGENAMNPGLYSITARRNGSTTNSFLVEIVKLRSYNSHGGGNDNNDIALFVRDNVDIPWSCLIYNGEGD